MYHKKLLLLILCVTTINGMDKEEKQPNNKDDSLELTHLGYRTITIKINNTIKTSYDLNTRMSASSTVKDLKAFIAHAGRNYKCFDEEHIKAESLKLFDKNNSEIQDNILIKNLDVKNQVLLCKTIINNLDIHKKS